MILSRFSPMLAREPWKRLFGESVEADIPFPAKLFVPLLAPTSARLSHFGCTLWALPLDVVFVEAQVVFEGLPPMGLQQGRP